MNLKSLLLVASNSQLAYCADEDLPSGFPGKIGTGYSGDITIEAWVYLNSLPSAGSNSTIVSKGTSVSFMLSIISSGGLLFRYDNGGGGTSSYTDSFVFPVGSWVHIAVTVDVSAKDIKFYVNGSQVADTNASNNDTAIGLTSSPFCVGCRYVGSYERFLDGYIDEVRVWSCIRTETQIDDNKDKEFFGYIPNLMAYYKFNDNFVSTTLHPCDLIPFNNPDFDSNVPFVGSSFVPKSIIY